VTGEEVGLIVAWVTVGAAVGVAHRRVRAFRDGEGRGASPPRSRVTGGAQAPTAEQDQEEIMATITQSQQGSRRRAPQPQRRGQQQGQMDPADVERFNGWKAYFLQADGLLRIDLNVGTAEAPMTTQVVGHVHEVGLSGFQRAEVTVKDAETGTLVRFVLAALLGVEEIDEATGEIAEAEAEERPAAPEPPKKRQAKKSGTEEAPV